MPAAEPAGALVGMSFCQKPGPPAPFGYRCRFSGRSARCGSMTGATRAKYRMSSRLVTGSRRRRPGRKELLVEVREHEASCPPTSHAPRRSRPLEGRHPSRGRGSWPAGVGAGVAARRVASGSALGRRGSATPESITVSGRSRTTARGSRPGSMPLKAAWRTRSSRVQSANSARITSSGPTQRTPAGRPPFPPPGSADQRGGVSAHAVEAAAQRLARPRIDDPLPTLPAYRSRPSSYTPTTSAPSSVRVPSPGR